MELTVLACVTLTTAMHTTFEHEPSCSVPAVQDVVSGTWWSPQRSVLRAIAALENAGSVETSVTGPSQVGSSMLVA